MRTMTVKRIGHGTVKVLLATGLLAVASGDVFAEEGIRFGADLRVRQEMMDNLPGNPGDPYAVSSVPRAKNKNQIRIRPRVWMEARGEKFRFYTRLADEFREYPVTGGVKRRNRAYDFPDEVFLDNLYFEGMGLDAGFLSPLGVETVDFRIGRQDMVGPGGSIFGLDRLVFEGTPTDGSRSFFSDMARATLHFDAAHRLDLFALYDNGRNDLRFGTHRSRHRALNCINMSDSPDLDEWGGGLVYHGSACDDGLRYKLYSIFKRSESYVTQRPAPRKMSAKEVTTLGFLLNPRFNERWEMEIEAAKQFGRVVSGNRQAGGWMNHTELKYHPDCLRDWKGTVSLANTYYSGDKNRLGDGHNDTAWDPLWGRYTQDSELLVYGAVYGNCQWSNMIYSKIKLTLAFGPHHAFYAYTGPMFAAVQDHLGHADGGGSSKFKGLLSAMRYDFPIRLAPKGASGLDRLEIFGHVVGELFNPGDYYDSTKPSYFVRWQVEIRF